MFRSIAAVAIFVLAGCGGGPRWQGAYSGAHAVQGSCSDGSQQPRVTDTDTIAITAQGDRLSFPAHCGVTVTATVVSGDAATIAPVACPATTNGGTTAVLQVTGGSIRLVGDDLEMDLSVLDTLTGNANGTCTLGETWRLRRQPN